MSQPELFCEWIEDPKIGWWHLPGCWGAVNAGPDGCYCEPEKNSVLGRLASLEAKLAELTCGDVSPNPTANSGES